MVHSLLRPENNSVVYFTFKTCHSCCLMPLCGMHACICAFGSFIATFCLALLILLPIHSLVHPFVDVKLPGHRVKHNAEDQEHKEK